MLESLSRRTTISPKESTYDKHLLEDLGPAMEGWWADLGRIEHVTSQMAEKAEAGINEILKVHTASEIAAARDNVLLQTLKAKVADKRLPY